MENKNKEDAIGLKSILVRYMHHWKLFVWVFILSFIPAILYLVFYPRTYEFMARIQIQEDKESGMSSFGLGEAEGLMKSFGIGGGSGSINIDDEVSILSSNRLLSKMILKLGINVSYSKPYSFYRMYDDSPLKLTADSATWKNLNDEYRFNVSVSPDKIKVKAVSKESDISESFVYNSLPAIIKIDNKEFKLDYNNGATNGSYKLKIRCFPTSWIAEILAKDIGIEDVTNLSNVLEFTYSDHSKNRGKDMLNTLVSEYNKDALSFKQIEDNKTMDFVNNRISVVLAELANVESDLEKYKTKNNMTLLESDVDMYGEEISGLQKAIIEAEAQSRIINMLDEYIKDPANKYNVVPSLMTVAEGEKGGAISSYNEAIVERDKLLKNSNKSNPMFETVDRQVDKLREGVYAMIKNAQESSRITLEDLKNKENAIISKMKTVPAKEREYVNFRRNQEIYQGLYLMLLQKREETVLSLGKQTDHARLIDPAFVKKKPLGPRKLYALIGILALTFVVPIGYLFAKSLFVSIKEEYKRTS